MTKGFGKPSKPIQMDPLTDAAETLLLIAKGIKKPLILAMHPPDNHHNLKPGQVQGTASTEIRPGCDGLVIAIAGSADEVQALLDLVMSWSDKKKEGDRDV